MSNEEYRAFLEYLCHEYLEARLPRIHNHHFPEDMFGYRLRELRTALDLLRYIQDHIDSTENVYRTFRPSAIASAVHDIRNGVSDHNRYAKEGGLFDAWDAHYQEIIEGLEIDLFPPSELGIFANLGSRDPKTDLQGIIYSLKRRAVFDRQRKSQIRISAELESIYDRLEKEAEQFEKADEKDVEELPKKPRRWFKGLGKIGQGAGLSIADIAFS